MAKIIKYLLILYRKIKISPPACRHYPSCSCYAEEAVDKYGVLKGGYLALKRVIRCNQLFPGGYDPIP